VRKYSVATKRAIRAILKAADLCVENPARVAQRMVNTGLPRVPLFGRSVDVWAI